MAWSLQEFSQFIWCSKHRTAANSCQPSDQANQLGARVLPYAARVYTHHCHLLLLLSDKADTYFIVLQRAKG